MDKIERITMNFPYYESTQYWKYNKETNSFSLTVGRRLQDI